MKKILLSTLLLLFISIGSFAQQPPTTEQQRELNNAMQMLNKSLDSLGNTLRALDSLHVNVPNLDYLDKAQEYLQSLEQQNGDSSEDENDSDIEKTETFRIRINGDDTAITKTEVRIINDDEEKETNDSNDKELKNVRTIWGGLDVGFNSYLNEQGAIAASTRYPQLALNQGKSVEVNIHVIHQDVNLIKHVLTLDYGLYFQIENYRFSNTGSTLIPRVDTIGFGSPDNPLKKSKLTCTYLTIPLTVDIETNPRHRAKSFRLSAGGFAGVLIGSHTKEVDESGDKTKIHDDFNLNPFRYGLTGKVGYGPVCLYVDYAMSTLFNSDIQDDLKPVSAGLELWF